MFKILLNVSNQSISSITSTQDAQKERVRIGPKHCPLSSPKASDLIYSLLTGTPVATTSWFGLESTPHVGQKCHPGWRVPPQQAQTLEAALLLSCNCPCAERFIKQWHLLHRNTSLVSPNVHTGMKNALNVFAISTLWIVPSEQLGHCATFVSRVRLTVGSTPPTKKKNIVMRWVLWILWEEEAWVARLNASHHGGGRVCLLRKSEQYWHSWLGGSTRDWYCADSLFSLSHPTVCIVYSFSV